MILDIDAVLETVVALGRILVRSFQSESGKSHIVREDEETTRAGRGVKTRSRMLCVVTTAHRRARRYGAWLSAYERGPRGDNDIVIAGHVHIDVWPQVDNSGRIAGLGQRLHQNSA